MKRWIAFSLFAAFQMTAAPMLRVIAVKDSHTIVVDNRGVAADVRLAQVVIAPADEEAASAYLRQSLSNSWVMIESDATGAAFVYRSPDALFVNAELARGAFRSTGTHMVYVGEVTPGAKRLEKTPPKAPAPHVTASVPHRHRTRRR